MSKPEITFKMGAVRAAVFRNIIQQGGQSIALPKVLLEVRYRDKAGNWQSTSSLSINDLPKAIAALQKAYEYILSQQGKQPGIDSPSPDLSSAQDSSSLKTSPAKDSLPNSRSPKSIPETTWQPGGYRKGL